MYNRTFDLGEVKLLHVCHLFAIPWTVVYQDYPSVEFSRQEYWSGLPFPSPGHLPYLGTEPRLPALPADALPSEPQGKPMYNSKTDILSKIILSQ